MLWSALIAAALGAVPSPHPKMVVEPYEPVMMEWCMPSRLLVMGLEDELSGLVRVVVVVDAGDADGPAHVVEHLWFRSGEGSTVRDQLRAEGLVYSAITTLDATTYSLLGPPEKLPEMLGIAGRLVYDPLLGVDEAAVRAEWEIVQRERVYRGRWSQRAAYDQAIDTLFPEGHPYHGASRYRVGEPISVESLEQWVDETYRPHNATMFIVGDVDLDEAPGIMEGSIPEEALFRRPEGRRGGCAVRTPKEVEPPDPHQEEVAIIQAPVTRRMLTYAWSVPPAWTSDEALARFSVALLSVVLSAGMDEWVTDGMVKDIDCAYIPGEHASVVECQAQLADDARLSKVNRAFRAALRDTWGHDRDWIRQWLADRISRLTLGWAVQDLDHSMHRAEAFQRAEFAHFTREFDYLTHLVHHLADMDEQEVAKFSRRWFAEDRAVAVLVEPQRSLEESPVPSLPSADDAWLEQEVSPVPRLRPVFGNGEVRRLDNGLEILAIPRTQVPYAEAALLFRGGGLDQPEAGCHMAHEASWYWRSPEEPFLMAIRAGGGVFSETGDRSTAITNHGSSGNVADLVQHLRHLSSVTRIHTQDRQLRLDRRAQWMYYFGLSEAWWWAEPSRHGRLFPDHPYGRPWWEELEAARRVRDSKVYEWHKSTRQPSNAALVVTGRVEPGEALELGERWFRRWKDREEGFALEPVRLPPAPRRTVEVYDSDVAPSEVAVSCRLPERTAETTAALDLLHELLEVGLVDTLVTHSGVTYSPAVWITEYPGVSVLTMESDILAGVAPSALKTMLDLLQRIAEQDVPVGAIDREKPRAAVRHRISTGASATAILEAASREIAAGRDPLDLDLHPERLAAVTAEDLALALEECVGHEAITVIGPSGELLELLEVHQPVEVDWRTESQALFRDYGPPPHQL